MPKSTEYAAKVADDRGFIAYDAEEDAVWRDLMARQLPAVRPQGLLRQLPAARPQGRRSSRR